MTNKQQLEKIPLSEIKTRLEKNELPLSGFTELGSAEFHFLKPSFYAGVALHAGSKVRLGLVEKMAVSKADRYRDEDPFTDLFIRNFPIQIIALDSRFEYDLNRDRESCLYKKFKKKWNLLIWNEEPDNDEKKISCAKFDEFFQLMDMVSEYLLQQNRFGFLFDMHSFCYQRFEQKEWFVDQKPEINVGTKASNRKLFKPAIKNLIKNFKTLKIGDHQIRVAENEIFKGGYLSRRTGKNHYNNILTFALEYKKIFMNEISGELYPEVLENLIKNFEESVEQLFADKTFKKKYLTA